MQQKIALIYSKTLEVFQVKNDVAVLRYKVHNVLDTYCPRKLKKCLAGCLSNF